MAAEVEALCEVDHTVLVLRILGNVNDVRRESEMHLPIPVTSSEC